MSLKNTDVRTPGAAAIAQKWNLPLAKVYALISQGAKVEFEHNRDKEKAKQVARDHINERPDYYKRLRSMERLPIRMKEETGVGGVRGLGYVSGDPSGTDYIQKYIDSNAMSYVDNNGNKLEYNKKNHKKLHKLSFNDFDPKNVKNAKNFVNEGMSAGPERESDYSIGDPGGGRTVLRKGVEEDFAKIKGKLKKAAKVGSVVGALGAHAGKVYDVGNVVSHHDDPGLATATAVSYLHPASRMLQAAPTVLKVDKAGKGENEFKRQKLYGGKKLQMKEDKGPCWKGYEQVGMKKKGGRKVPNCVPVKESGQVMSRYTERPTYEQEQLPKVGGIERGIYETSLAKKVKYMVKAHGQSQRIAKDLGQDAVKDKTYQKRQKGLNRALNEFDMSKMARTAADTIAPGSVAAYDAAKQGNYADAANKAAGAGVGFLASRVAPAASAVLKSTAAAAAEMTPDMESKIRAAKQSGQNVGPGSSINEIKASTVGRAVAKAAKERKELTSKKMGDKEIKQWWKRERLVRKGTEKLTGKSKIPATLDDDPPFKGGHKRSHEKSSTHVRRLATKAMKKYMKEAQQDKDWDDYNTPFREGVDPNKPDTALDKRTGATGITKTIHQEETYMDSKEHIQEAINAMLDKNLVEMKENLLTALQEKTIEKLEERKKDIAANYFAQD